MNKKPKCKNKTINLSIKISILFKQSHCKSKGRIEHQCVNLVKYSEYLMCIVVAFLWID